MKRLRSLSIAHPASLGKRNHSIAWGEPFWRNRELRKRREWQLRRIRQGPWLVVPYSSPEALPGETPVDAPPAPAVH